MRVSVLYINFQDFMKYPKQISHLDKRNTTSLFVQKSTAFCPCCLAFIKRRRNCVTLLLSISEQDSTSRPYVTQSFQSLSAWFIAPSHLLHMVKAGKTHFSNRSLKRKFLLPTEVLQTDTTGPLPEAKATSDSRDLIHKEHSRC